MVVVGRFRITIPKGGFIPVAITTGFDTFLAEWLALVAFYPSDSNIE